MRNIIALLVVSALLAACGSSNRTRFVDRLTPAPTAPVQGEQLAPPPGSQQQVAGQQQLTDPNSQVAAAPQAPPTARPSPVATTTAPPKKEDVLGQWTIADASSACQLNVSLTGWQGGYRASTRNCTSADLSKVGAWNIVGNNVVLKDQSGQQLATLVRTSERRFDGRLSTGGAVALMR